MKKYILLILCILLCFLFISCNKTENNKNDTETESNPENEMSYSGYSVYICLYFDSMSHLKHALKNEYIDEDYLQNAQHLDFDYDLPDPDKLFDLTYPDYLTFSNGGYYGHGPCILNSRYICYRMSFESTNDNLFGEVVIDFFKNRKDFDTGILYEKKYEEHSYKFSSDTINYLVIDRSGSLPGSDDWIPRTVYCEDFVNNVYYTLSFTDKYDNIYQKVNPELIEFIESFKPIEVPEYEGFDYYGDSFDSLCGEITGNGLKIENIRQLNKNMYMTEILELLGRPQRIEQKSEENTVLAEWDTENGKVFHAKFTYNETLMPKQYLTLESFDEF